MLFGLTNILAIFQAIINHVPREYLDNFVVVYLDDILIYLVNIDKHREYVYKVLKKLQEVKLLVKPRKSEFHVQITDFLGYTILPREIYIEATKIIAI